MSAVAEQLRGELLRCIWQEGPVSAAELLDLAEEAGANLGEVAGHLVTLRVQQLIHLDESPVNPLYSPGPNENIARRSPVPGLFCPGKGLPGLRVPLEPGRLYGVAVEGDWVTVMLREDGLHWRAMRAGDLGVGSRGELTRYLRGRATGRAA